MVKKLKLMRPPLTGYLEEAYPLSIALTRESNREWLYCNYIQLVYQNPLFFCNQPVKFYKVSYFNGQVWNAECPLLCYDKITRGMLVLLNISIVDYICKALMGGSCVKLFLDEYYMPDSVAYHKNHYIHENLFWGIDTEKEEVYGMAYVTDELGYNYKEFSVSFKELHQAYSISNDLGIQQERIVLMSCNEERFYEFDYEVVKKGIYDYLTSTKTDLKYSDIINPDSKMSFGLDIYEKLIDYFANNIEETSIIPLHIIYEHKKLMLERIYYMVDNHYVEDNQDIIEDYNKLIKKAYSLKILYLKYQLTSDVHVQKKLIKSMTELRDMDIEITRRLYDVLNERHDLESINKIFSRWGWWKDVAYRLCKNEEGRVDITFSLHIINSNTRGYIRITNEKCLQNYFSPFSFKIDANKSEFGVANSYDLNYIALDNISCRKGESYIIRFNVDLETREYFITVFGKENSVCYRNKYDTTIMEYMKSINYIVLIHENSYRYYITDLKQY